jgi:Protein of unknown function (DUF4232)
MTASASAMRALAAAAVFACPAALAAACGTSAAPAASPAASPAVIATPTVSAGTASPASSPTAAPTPAGAAPACATSALKVRVASVPGGAAAGSSYYPVQFANISGASCTLYGYPGVSFVTAPGGSQIGPAAIRNPATAAQLVTVVPGQTVHAELQVVDAQNYPPADCGVVTAHWLKVYPPNQTAPAYISFTAPACSKPRQILSVQTVQPGAAGP